MILRIILRAYYGISMLFGMYLLIERVMTPPALRTGSPWEHATIIIIGLLIGGLGWEKV